MEFDKNLALFQEVSSGVRELHNRLEPVKTGISRREWDGLYARNKKWGGWVYVIGTGFVSDGICYDLADAEKSEDETLGKNIPTAPPIFLQKAAAAYV